MANHDETFRPSAIAYILLAIVNATFGAPYVLQHVWNWFSPYVNTAAPSISYSQAFAASVLISYVATRIVTGAKTPRDNDPKRWQKISEALRKSICTTWITFGIAWISYLILRGIA